MSANPLDFFVAYGGQSKPTEARNSHPLERRRRARTRLRWSVLLFRKDAPEAVETVTENLSSDGLYFLVKEAFALDELLTCTLKVPTHDPDGKQLERLLECRVRVTRIDPQEQPGLYGIACEVEDYHFSPPASAARLSEAVPAKVRT
jgi:hypothetical protein